MDEFQDTNGQQARLMRLVRPPDRFYAVGDINQSIFGFRHAESEGFSRYRDQIEETGGRLVQLVANFRSRAEILRAVETIVQGAPGIERRSLVAGRKFKTERPECVELIVAPSLTAEAEWLAYRILELARLPFEFKDVAVLVRNTEVISEFTSAFDDSGVS